MIFGRVCVICDEFGDYHDEIVVTRGGVLLGAPYEDNDSGSTISSSVAAERKSSYEGDKSASYVIPDDATADILSAI